MRLETLESGIEAPAPPAERPDARDGYFAALARAREDYDAELMRAITNADRGLCRIQLLELGFARTTAFEHLRTLKNAGYLKCEARPLEGEAPDGALRGLKGRPRIFWVPTGRPFNGWGVDELSSARVKRPPRSGASPAECPLR